MRALLRASDTAFALALGVAVAMGGGAVACAKPSAKQAPPRDPPPRVLVVALDRISLRTTAWVELHAWLGAAAREGTALDEAALDDAARRYARALRDDHDDAAFTATLRALAACLDERCARTALAGTPFERAYLDALPTFTARRWLDRATLSRGGVEAARAAMGPEIDPLITELSKDLAITWPSPSPIVDVVAISPPAGRHALVRPLLGARSSCFVGEAKESPRVHDARIIDCTLFYAAARLGPDSALYEALAKRLMPREATYVWTLLVAHAVAVRVTTWEQAHVSPPRRSAAAIEGALLTWLVRHWPARMNGEPVDAFATRLLEERARLLDEHAR